MLHSGTHFRHGLLQLMIHTIDPLHDGSSNFGSCISHLHILLDGLLYKLCVGVMVEVGVDEAGFFNLVIYKTNKNIGFCLVENGLTKNRYYNIYKKKIQFEFFFR